jgi:hypothetical protein
MMTEEQAWQVVRRMTSMDMVAELERQDVEDGWDYPHPLNPYRRWSQDELENALMARLTHRGRPDPLTDYASCWNLVADETHLLDLSGMFDEVTA